MWQRFKPETDNSHRERSPRSIATRSFPRLYVLLSLLSVVLIYNHWRNSASYSGYHMRNISKFYQRVINFKLKFIKNTVVQFYVLLPFYCEYLLERWLVKYI